MQITVRFVVSKKKYFIINSKYIKTNRKLSKNLRRKMEGTAVLNIYQKEKKLRE